MFRFWVFGVAWCVSLRVLEYIWGLLIVACLCLWYTKSNFSLIYNRDTIIEADCSIVPWYCM